MKAVGGREAQHGCLKRVMILDDLRDRTVNLSGGTAAVAAPDPTESAASAKDDPNVGVGRH